MLNVSLLGKVSHRDVLAPTWGLAVPACRTHSYSDSRLSLLVKKICNCYGLKWQVSSLFLYSVFIRISRVFGGFLPGAAGAQNEPQDGAGVYTSASESL